MPENQKICPPHRGVIPSRDRIAPSDLGSGTGRLLVIAGVMTVVLAASASLMVYQSWKPRDAISSEVVERLDRKGQLAAGRLVGEPCNRTLQGELVTSLMEHAEYGTIVAFSEQTAAKCGSNEELLPTVFWAQLRSSDFVAAERTANQLVVEVSRRPKCVWPKGQSAGKARQFCRCLCRYGNSAVSLSGPV